MGKSVAVDGEVIATPAPPGNFYPPADSGTWSVSVEGTVSYKSYEKLSGDNIKVIYEAECTFSFLGTQSSSGATVEGSEIVTLSAGTTKLQKNLSKVLVNGDTKTGIYGNELKVQSSGKLKTA